MAHARRGPPAILHARGGADPIKHDQDVIWTPCPLFQPVRASFICKPARPAPETGPEAGPEAEPTPETD